MVDLDKAIQIAESFVNGFCTDDKDHVGRVMELGQGKTILESLQFAKSQQAEVERLEKENGTLKLTVQSMPNWLNEKRPEVVRCKDCKHSVPSSENFVVCTAPYSQLVHTTYKPIDWYCPDGERKDGDRDV